MYKIGNVVYIKSHNLIGTITNIDEPDDVDIIYYRAETQYEIRYNEPCCSFYRWFSEKELSPIFDYKKDKIFDLANI